MHAALSAVTHGGVAAAAMAAAETVGSKVYNNFGATTPRFITDHGIPLAMIAGGALLGLMRNSYARAGAVGLVAAGALHELSFFAGNRADVNFGA